MFRPGIHVLCIAQEEIMLHEKHVDGPNKCDGHDGKGECPRKRGGRSVAGPKGRG